jgi:hypothetical protein
MLVPENIQKKSPSSASSPSQKSATPPPPLPPPSASSRDSSVDPHIVINRSRDKSAERTVAASLLLSSSDVISSKPPSSAAASTSAKQPTTTKPKSNKAPRPRSPSPSPPPPPPPPLQTIRLEITLGGPDNYEVDIASIAKATGQRPATPVPVKRDTSDSEGDDEAEGDKPKIKRKVGYPIYLRVISPDECNRKKRPRRSIMIQPTRLSTILSWLWMSGRTSLRRNSKGFMYLAAKLP